MTKNFYIARHKKSGLFLKWEELCDNGYGHYVADIPLEDINLGIDCNCPSMLQTPEINRYVSVISNGWPKKDIPHNELEFLLVKVEICLPKANITNY